MNNAIKDICYFDYDGHHYYADITPNYKLLQSTVLFTVNVTGSDTELSFSMYLDDDGEWKTTWPFQGSEAIAKIIGNIIESRFL